MLNLLSDVYINNTAKPCIALIIYGLFLPYIWVKHYYIINVIFYIT